MQMGEGVEWALHSCLNLGWNEGAAATAARLADFYGLPAAYLNKQLQALARAGILTSTPGPRGGFRLARRLEEITLLDVVIAIEGPEDAFRCRQILKEGPGGDPAVDYLESCVLNGAMRRADLAWRRELTAQTLAEIRDTVERRFPGTPESTRARLTSGRAPAR
jgi:Rrf2 family protein